MTADNTSRNGLILPLLVWFSAACFAGAFVTDLVYWRTVAVTWETFSVWLIPVRMILAALAIIAFLIDLVGGKRIRTRNWPFAIGYAIAVLLSLLNAFIHSRDAYTAVVPTGLTLSTLVVVVLLFSAWMGSASTNRHRVGAST